MWTYSKTKDARDITESPGSARLTFHVMLGEGPVSTSCSAGLANAVDSRAFARA